MLEDMRKPGASTARAHASSLMTLCVLNALNIPRAVVYQSDIDPESAVTKRPYFARWKRMPPLFRLQFVMPRFPAYQADSLVLPAAEDLRQIMEPNPCRRYGTHRLRTYRQRSYR